MADTRIDIKGLEEYRDKLKEIDVDAFCDACTKEIAARLLRGVIKRTPVGVYPNIEGKVGGTLRRGWGKQSDFRIRHFGNAYVIEIINPVEYAGYVENGHRTRNHTGWVNGRFMLKITEDELNKATPAILQAKLNKWLKGVLK